MVLTLVIKSKHQKSFFIYLFILYTMLNKLNVVKTLINKNNYHIKFALLKSPHINKLAQQHFGFSIYKKKVIILLPDLTKFILLTKLLLWKLFHDIYIIVNYNLFRKIKVVIIKHCFIDFNFEIIKLRGILIKVDKMAKMLNFICLKVLLKLITQRKSIRLINEKLTVQFCFS